MQDARWQAFDAGVQKQGKCGHPPPAEWNTDSNSGDSVVNRQGRLFGHHVHPQASTMRFFSESATCMSDVSFVNRARDRDTAHALWAIVSLPA